MKKFFRVLSFIALMAMIITSLTSCAQKQSILIAVDGKQIQADCSSKDTVSQVLEKNNIKLSENDRITPSVDEKIGKTEKIKIERYAKVTVDIDGKKKTVELYDGTVETALKKLNVKVSNEDKLSEQKDKKLKDGMTIRIQKAKTVNITVDKKEKKFKVVANSVEQALKMCTIEIGENDIVTPALNQKLKNNIKITVKRVKVETVKETVSIPYKVKNEYTSSMLKGKSKVKTNGANGSKEITYEMTYVDGKLTEKKKISEKVVKSAVDKVVLYGTKVQKTTAAATTVKSTTKAPSTTAKTVVSKEKVFDCDGSGNGYYIITYSDGSVEYQDF